MQGPRQQQQQGMQKREQGRERQRAMRLHTERRGREAGRGMHALKEGLDQFPALIIATQWRTGHPWNDIAFNFARRQLSASAAAACMVVFAMVPCQKGASQNAWIDSLRTYRQTLQSPTCMHETITDVSLSLSPACSSGLREFVANRCDVMHQLVCSTILPSQ
jgi:hypothetical protein